ncbi:30S ribosomal protein S8 [Candidatus Saccharibacteria bacterium]|nr:ribosomal protein S8 [uncultured bacterium]PID30591.1 MAG: 30S ribosomal protein S8 [Candidatus Saccharibacteria bacterium]PID99327.1 MAG: 30S ribosomal protein S8 [Candidatus Saccharibacteria bacterium]
MSVTTTDPISDMLTRIRNAIAVGKSEVSLPHSKIKESVAVSLKNNGFLHDVRSEDLSVGKRLHITINREGENARITDIKRLSKPGRRAYTNAREVPQVKRGRGILIVSTSKGLMTGEEAKAQGVGGELICQVY